MIRVQSYKEAVRGNGQGGSSVAERPTEPHVFDVHTTAVSDLPSTSGRQASLASRPPELKLTAAYGKTSDAIQQEEESFVWTKQWYPLAVVDDLNPLKPFATKLLGMRACFLACARGL